MKQDLLSLVRTVSRIYLNGLNERLAAQGYTARQWGLLKLLVEEGSMTFSEVAERWQMENPTVTPVAQFLTRQGLIELHTGSDKRQKVMIVTDVGMEKYAELKELIAPYIEELCTGLDEHQLEAMREGLEQIYRNMKKRG